MGLVFCQKRVTLIFTWLNATGEFVDLLVYSKLKKKSLSFDILHLKLLLN